MLPGVKNIWIVRKINTGLKRQDEVVGVLEVQWVTLLHQIINTTQVNFEKGPYFHTFHLTVVCFHQFRLLSPKGYVFVLFFCFFYSTSRCISHNSSIFKSEVENVHLTLKTITVRVISLFLTNIPFMKLLNKLKLVRHKSWKQTFLLFFEVKNIYTSTNTTFCLNKPYPMIREGPHSFLHTVLPKKNAKLSTTITAYCWPPSRAKPITGS